MASLLQEVIRLITLRAKTEGVTETTAELNSLAAAQGGVAVASEKTERATISLTNRINSLQKSLDAEYRAEQQLARINKDLDAARAQGLITADRQNQLSTLAAAKFKVQGEAAVKAAEGMRVLKDVTLGFIGGIGAGVLIGAIAELPTAIAEAVDKLGNIANVAQTIGVTTKALQELRFAAQQSDVDVGTLDSAMQKFSTNLGKADSPLDKILKLNDVKITGDVMKDLEHFADLVKNASNQEERNALVTQAFGKSTQEMGRLFEDGGKGIATWAAEAEHAGAVIGEDKIQRARDLNDQMKALTPALQAAQSEFAVMVMPAEVAVLQWFNDALRYTQTLLGAINNLDLKGIAKIIAGDTGRPASHPSLMGWLSDNVAIDWDGTGSHVTGNKALVPSLNRNASGGPDSRGSGAIKPSDFDFRSVFKDSGKRGTLLPFTPDAAAASAEKAYDRLNESTEKRVLQLHNEADAYKAAGLAADTMRAYSELLNQAEATGAKLGPERIAKLHEEAEALAKAQEALSGAKLNQQDRSPFEVMGDQIDSLSEKLDHGAISWNTYNIEVGKAAEQMAQAYGDAADDVISNLEKLTDNLGLSGQAAFETHKALSIAKAVVSGGEAIVHSYSAGSAIGGPVVGAIFAGIAAAATAAQIAAIASTSYSSTSMASPAASSGGAGAAAAAAAGPTTAVHIDLHSAAPGSSYDYKSIESLLSALKDYSKDGNTTITIGKAA